MQPWLDLLVKYGWPPLLAIAAIFFFYHTWWPDYVKRRDAAEQERRDREKLLREQAEKLSTVIQDNTTAVRAAATSVQKSGELSEKLVQKIEALDATVKQNGDHIDRLEDKMDVFGEAFKELRLIFFKNRKGDE